MSENRDAQAVEELVKILGSIDVQNADITSGNSGANGIDLKPLTHVVTGKFPLSEKVSREVGQGGPAALYNTIKGAASGSTDGYVEEGKRGIIPKGYHAHASGYFGGYVERALANQLKAVTK